MVCLPGNGGFYQMGEEGKYKFPVELLAKTKEERIKYFADCVIEHEFLEVAINKTIRLISNAVPERIVFTCGPSGVGKSQLIKIIKSKLVQAGTVKLSDNPGCIPVVDVQAIAPLKGGFDFPGLWRDALEKMDEPMLNRKISYHDVIVKNSFGKDVILSQTKKADYMKVLQNTLRYRDVTAFIIDEAHHMLRVVSGKESNWSVDLIKSLTNLSQTPIILVGTYDLTSLLVDLNIKSTDQINQRTRIVDFPRYRSDVTSEVNIFGKTAKKLLQNMPLEQTAENMINKQDWKYFYKYSLGCVGTLKLWFMDAYGLALESNAKTLTREHLEEAKLSEYRLLGMHQSIEEGERMMKKIQSEGDIDSKLVYAKSEDESQSDSKKSKTKGNPKPFNRKPKRDMVM